MEYFNKWDMIKIFAGFMLVIAACVFLLLSSFHGCSDMYCQSCYAEEKECAEYWNENDMCGR